MAIENEKLSLQDVPFSSSANILELATYNEACRIVEESSGIIKGRDDIRIFTYSRWLNLLGINPMGNEESQLYFKNFFKHYNPEYYEGMNGRANYANSVEVRNTPSAEEFLSILLLRSILYIPSEAISARHAIFKSVNGSRRQVSNGIRFETNIDGTVRIIYVIGDKAYAIDSSGDLYFIESDELIKTNSEKIHYLRHQKDKKGKKTDDIPDYVYDDEEDII